MSEPVLKAKDLVKRFASKGADDVVAVDGVSFSVMPGECVGLVGGSGSGKSTVARMVAHLLEPTSGTIELNGVEAAGTGRRARRHIAKSVQMVFQEPAASFDPRRTLGEGIAEGLLNFGASKAHARETATSLLGRCGLPAEFADRYPHEASGGQCQRAAIARALALDPPLIVLDEPTSALDVTVQVQIVDLLRDMRAERGTAYLFICHDLALAQAFCDRILVMHAGRIVEEGAALEVTTNPQHPYTRKLLAAVGDLATSKGKAKDAVAAV